MNKDFFNPDPKKFSQPKLPKGLKKMSDKNMGKNGLKRPTGQLSLFKEIFIAQKGKCMITGEEIPFHPNCFMHLLSKGAYPKFKLYKPNIWLVLEEIHYLYDNSSIEILLDQYPAAKIIYEKKEDLKILYYKKEPTT